MTSPALDLRDKLRLERTLRRPLRRYHKRIVNSFRLQYGVDASIINVEQFDTELEDILRVHYDRVINVFSNRLTPTMPLDVAVTEGEREIIEEALLLWLMGQAAEQATFINTTTQKHASEAVELALEDETVREQVGAAARLTTATIAGAYLNRALRSRETTIVINETSGPAEIAKATEAEVLAGLSPSITGRSNALSPVTKTWRSVGDSRVRSAHLLADGQIRQLNAVYNVGGEQLMQPRDRTHGATSSNVINCRCISEIKGTEIIEVRRNV